MKFLSAVLTAIVTSSVTAIHHTADIYYHAKQYLGPGMWHFSADGLTIYSVDGSKVLKEHRKESLCKPYMGWSGEMSYDCYYFTQASDGHKYVWAASMGGMNSAHAFDIDTGEFAGYIPTCSTPIDLQYHATREEMWLRCAQSDFNGGHEGEIDVFSSNSLSADFEHVYLNATSRPYGRIAVDSSMEGYGYVSAYNLPYLAEIDLSTKEVSATYDLPNAYGAYDMTHSPVNNHVYMRARVCCSCGFPGADDEECPGRFGLVNVTTGPTAGMMNVNGTCSSSCEGNSADTIGVYEFDTVNKVVVTNHNIKEGTGFGADPVSSPDGEHILLLPNDGGQYVRILKAGKNGDASEMVHDVPVEFEGGLPTRTVVSDFAFVKDDSRNILVLAASSDNNVVLVDLLSSNYAMTKLQLTTASESTGGSKRSVEWAVGSNYVWVNGVSTNEQYIIEVPGSDINDARVVRQLTDVTPGQMVYVENYERKRVMSEVASMMMAETAKFIVSDSSADTTVADTTAKEATATPEPDDDDADPLAVAALVIASCGLLLGIALAVLAARKPEDQSGNRTLGSKGMN